MPEIKMTPTISIVHDYLRTYGGGERVLEELHNIFPKAKIYVATADYKRIGMSANRFKKLNIKTSWAQAFPFLVKRPLLYRPILPFIWSGIDLKKTDIVISSSGSNIAKGVRIPKNAIHICYCHTPPRFLYNLETETSFLDMPLFRLVMSPFINFLRIYDKITNKKVDIFIANSTNVQKRVMKFYNRDSVVVYPPCNVPKKFKVIKKEDYFLVVSRLVKYKNIDLIIKAFNQNHLLLKIVGSGKDEIKLKKLAKNNIEFLGEIDDTKLRGMYAKARALVVATDNEDFGMTAAEAMGFATPVIAFNSGGLKEIVTDSLNGVFFYNKTVKSLLNAIKKFNSIKFDQRTIWSSAQKFSRKRFQNDIKQIVYDSFKNHEEN